MENPRPTGATIPYQLRPHKAIERNLFVDILNILNASNKINLKDYRYVGFGAAFLEDYKIVHLEFGITDMHCIEIDKSAYSRQVFNNPYYFIKIYPCLSTKYINEDYKHDKNQVVWLDYASPRDIRQQLQDLEIFCAKVENLDILKVTFNTKTGSFISSHSIRDAHGSLIKEYHFKNILQFLKDDPTYRVYLPAQISVNDVRDFSATIRAMAVRAIKRGLHAGRKGLKFHQISTFTYSDGQDMSTITGIFSTNDEFEEISTECRIKEWPFFKSANGTSEFIPAVEIIVPSMTISERIEIDRQIPSVNVQDLANSLQFKYSTDEAIHTLLIEGYHKFYKYLPYYSKVTY